MSENETKHEKTSATRRDFLRTTAQLGAGLALAQVALAQEATPAPAAAATTESAAPAIVSNNPDDINIVMIGLGAQGQVLMDSIIKIPNIKVKAVCDIWDFNRKRAAGLLKKYGHKVNSYVDYQEMLATEKDVHAAVIASPDFMHAEHAIACMQNGWNVYCEKEMSNSLEKARQMVITSRETGKLLQIGHQRRSNPRYQHAIDRLLLQEKITGRITHAYGQWNRAKSDDIGWPEKYTIPQDILDKYGYESMQHFRNWRWYRKYGGGPIVDLGSHQIDIFAWVFRNNPKSVVASGGVDFYKHHEWFDNVLCIYEYENDEGVGRAFYEVLTTSGNGAFYENFMGEDGTLAISELVPRGNAITREAHSPEEKWLKLADAGMLTRPPKPKPQPKKASNAAVDVRSSPPTVGWPLPIELLKPAHMPHLENFFAAVRGNAKLNCPGEIGYETAVAVLNVNKAVETGVKHEFKPEDFKV